MFKQIILPLLLAGAFITAVGLLTQAGQSKRNIPFLTIPQNSSEVTNKPKLKIDDTEVFVDIADSSSERAKGLSGRTTLAENEGMLFLFDSDNTVPSFWMKDMKISIDIIWIDDGVVEKIDKNVNPEPGINDNDLKKYYPDGPIDQVLEVSAGFSEKNGVNVGDSIELPETN